MRRVKPVQEIRDQNLGENRYRKNTRVTDAGSGNTGSTISKSKIGKGSVSMSKIQVSDLTFGYEGSVDTIFEKVSFCIDTDWKLGFIGRNGKGKTTFLNLLLGKYEYEGKIYASASFDYFPYPVTEMQMEKCGADLLEELQPDCELWRVICEMNRLQISSKVLYRPFGTLSHGERTKVMLAMLFSRDNRFLLIDEPTNHLDIQARDNVKQYLGEKKGFILVSHDRDLLDACIDHVLVLNRETIRVEKGNFSSWWENKEKADAFYQAENEKHRREIGKLRLSSERAASWADKNEKTKIGYDPIEEPESTGRRAYIGGRTKKLQKRVKQMENRIEREIAEKEGLLKDLERPVDLKIFPLEPPKEVLVSARGYGMRFAGGESAQEVLRDFDLELRRGQRVFLKGPNGCGKSCFLKAVLNRCGVETSSGTGNSVQTCLESGRLETAGGLVVSYVSQDTSFLRGSLTELCERRGLEESLLKALLRQLDFERVQFLKNMEDYSEGQKKKVLIAASLLQRAHLYIWDEPLNYVDVFSRMQIEDLLLRYQPTMLVVEHDVRFCEKIATDVRIIFPF